MNRNLWSYFRLIVVLRYLKCKGTYTERFLDGDMHMRILKKPNYNVGNGGLYIEQLDM